MSDLGSNLTEFFVAELQFLAAEVGVLLRL